MPATPPRRLVLVPTGRSDAVVRRFRLARLAVEAREPREPRAGRFARPPERVIAGSTPNR